MPLRGRGFVPVDNDGNIYHYRRDYMLCLHKSSRYIQLARVTGYLDGHTQVANDSVLKPCVQK